MSSHLLNGQVEYQLTELAALPRAVVIVEERYSEIFAMSYARPAAVAGRACRVTDQLAGGCRSCADTPTAISPQHAAEVFEPTPATPEPSRADLRAWAKTVGLEVPDRGCARRFACLA
ncbi:hypothetical protein [Mycobacterium kansasii]|uniref:hypothetical protein n=1 Tax=Mycobacterium kansasii TaxID=1768 RepID=UPI002156262A